MDETVGRRRFLKESGIAALSLAGVMRSNDSRAQSPVPNSSGTAAPRVKAPANACDCHHHIYDPVRFPPPPRATNPIVPNARVEDYRLLQNRLGTSRSIVVTPSAYLTDNRGTLDAIAQSGGQSRGVAVVARDITDAELRTLDEGGIRGIRFSLASATAEMTTIDAATVETIEALSKRIEPLGWHVQFNVTAEQIVSAGYLWRRLPSAIVFDHMGHIPQPAGTAHQAFGIVRRLLDGGGTWVKLSVTYDSSKVGAPTYADVNAVGRSYVQATPERLVWGSNWPHPNEAAKPDDAALLDLLAEWAPAEAARHRILVDNPATLYGFAKQG